MNKTWESTVLPDVLQGIKDQQQTHIVEKQSALWKDKIHYQAKLLVPLHLLLSLWKVKATDSDRYLSFRQKQLSSSSDYFFVQHQRKLFPQVSKKIFNMNLIVNGFMKDFRFDVTICNIHFSEMKDGIVKLRE